MTSPLTPDRKRRVQQWLAQINVLLDNAIEKLEEVERQGVAAVDPNTGALIGVLPDINAANALVRQWLTDSIDRKTLLIRGEFPDVPVHEGVINFFFLYFWWWRLDNLRAEIDRAEHEAARGEGEDDARLWELFWATLGPLMLELEQLGVQWDPHQRAALERLLDRMRSVRRLLRWMEIARGSRLWLVLRFRLIRCLQRLMTSVDMAWGDFLDSLSDDGFDFRASLYWLRGIDDDLMWVAGSSPPAGLPLILPSVERLKSARRRKHELERLIADSRTD
jgi:hypothetical protein